MAEFTAGGHNYRSGLLDGDVQLRILKRLAPTFTALAAAVPDIMAALAARAADPEGAPPEAGADGASLGVLGPLGKAVGPVSAALAALSDADQSYIIDACIDVTSRVMPDNRAKPLRMPSGGLSNPREDGAAMVRLVIAYNVVRENFGDVLASFGVDLDGVMATALPARGRG